MGGAHYGNQNAAKYDLEAIAQRLDEWSQKADSRWLGDFLIQEKIGDPSYLSRWADKCPPFAQSLKLAKWRIASRLRNQLHDKKNPYNYGLFMREIGQYDSMLRDYEREEKSFEYGLKTQSEKQVTEEVVNKLDDMANTLKNFQDNLNKPNINDNKVS